MAFMDFLGQGVGGTTPINQQTTVAGTAGAPIGPTWGNALGSAMQYGSAPGSSAPMLGSAMRQQPRSGLQGMSMPQSAAEKQAAGSGDDSLGAILSVLLKVIGL